MSGLDLFVTKSYDKTPVKQGAKKMATGKAGKESFRSDPKGYMEKKPKASGPRRPSPTKSKDDNKRARPLPKSAPKPSAGKSEAAKQLGVLTQPLSARIKAEKEKAMAVRAGRRAASSTPAGRGASVASAKKNTKGTVTRGKSNPVLDAMRNAANSMTTNREKAMNEKLWREGGNRPKTKPKGK